MLKGWNKTQKNQARRMQPGTSQANFLLFSSLSQTLIFDVENNHFRKRKFDRFFLSPMSSRFISIRILFYFLKIVNKINILAAAAVDVDSLFKLLSRRQSRCGSTEKVPQLTSPSSGAPQKTCAELRLWKRFPLAHSLSFSLSSARTLSLALSFSHTHTLSPLLSRTVVL